MCVCHGDDNGYVDSAVNRSNARDKVRHQRRDELVADAIKVAGLHPDRDAVDSRQAKTRVMGESSQDVLGAGDEHAGAAGLAPDALVARPRRSVVT